MGTKTGISWTDATWNPIRGCSRVSEGCRHCYAERVAYRFSGEGQPYEGLVQVGADGQRRPQWNGRIRFVEEHLLDPLRWKGVLTGIARGEGELRHKAHRDGSISVTRERPRRIFVNSMSDLFHENVTDEMRDKIFAVMALCPQHTFQVLTKRPERMLQYLSENNERYPARMVFDAAEKIDPEEGYRFDVDIYWPLSNVHLGASVEDQKTADERIPLLLETPAAVRFISAEPLLGPLELTQLPNALGVAEGQKWLNSLGGYAWERADSCGIGAKLDWVIVGGESGPGARPMHPDWARSLRDQCKAAGVPFFFKQWGEWIDGVNMNDCDAGEFRGGGHHDWGTLPMSYRVGTKAAGCLLDGVEHHEFPAVRA